MHGTSLLDWASANISPVASGQPRFAVVWGVQRNALVSFEDGMNRDRSIQGIEGRYRRDVAELGSQKDRETRT